MDDPSVYRGYRRKTNPPGGLSRRKNAKWTCVQQHWKAISAVDQPVICSPAPSPCRYPRSEKLIWEGCLTARDSLVGGDVWEIYENCTHRTDVQVQYRASGEEYDPRDPGIGTIRSNLFCKMAEVVAPRATEASEKISFLPTRLYFIAWFYRLLII